MTNSMGYSICVKRAKFDGEMLYEATVRELPDVAEYGMSFTEAYALAIDTIKKTAEASEEQGWAIPPPIKSKPSNFKL